jgi:hypothetical protein
LLNDGGIIAPGDATGLTHVQGNLAMNAGSIALELGGVATGEFDRLVVDGTLAAGGMLRLSLVEEFSPTAGDVFDVLDFSLATGQFNVDLPLLDPGLAWNDDDLLVTGEMKVEAASAVNADADSDGDVDGQDFLIWQRGVGLTGQTGPGNGDADGNGEVEGEDLTAWKTRFGLPSAQNAAGVPEPASCWSLAWVLVFSLAAARATAADAE